MYSEGSGKGMLAVLAAILGAVAFAFWSQTKFILLFFWQLLLLNLQPIFDFFSHHWPFAK